MSVTVQQIDYDFLNFLIVLKKTIVLIWALSYKI